MDNESQERGSALRSPWVWGCIGMVAAVFLANAVMIIIANITSPGLVVEDYYERGSNYARTQKKHAAQDALGWKAKLMTTGDITVNKPAAVQLRVVDSEGLPVNAGSVELFSFRPSDADADFSVILSNRYEGRYGGEIIFPLPGIWDMIVSVRRGDDLFETSHRIFVAKSKDS